MADLVSLEARRALLCDPQEVQTKKAACERAAKGITALWLLNDGQWASLILDLETWGAHPAHIEEAKNLRASVSLLAKSIERAAFKARGK